MDIQDLHDSPHLVARVAKLLHTEWSAFTRWSVLSSIEACLTQRTNAPDAAFTLVVLAADEPVATASVMRYELNDVAEREYWLGEVLTVPSARGQGLASALVNACVVRCRAQGIGALYLYTPDQQALYARLGWQTIEERRVAGESVSVMRLSLNT